MTMMEGTSRAGGLFFPFRLCAFGLALILREGRAPWVIIL